ncbi:MAG TPA: cytochrome c oxidase subunit 3, partial [Polyangia bacterium]|nr:cytochrome c oxidase subunit 3 [Polyangia bacterium]
MSTSDASVASASILAPTVERASAGKIGMWMFLATDAMGFAGLLIAYGVLRAHADQWPDPQERLDVLRAAVMTAALVTSSFTLTLAVRAARAGREGARAAWLTLTVLLGAAFFAGQVSEYRHLLTGPRPMGLTTDVFAGTFYAVTGYHGL